MNQETRKASSEFPPMSRRLKTLLANSTPEEHRSIIGAALLLLRMRKYGATNLDEAIQIARQMLGLESKEGLDESEK